jgi:hypothetical protein
LDGLTGGAAGSDSSVEASPDGSTGFDAPLEGSLDAPPSDASLDSPVEAPSSDAPVDGPFCATHPGHTLCADWDNGVLLQGFNRISVYGPEAGVDVSPDAYVSAPFSLHGGEGPITKAVAASGQLQYDLPSSVASVRIELDLMACDRTGFTGTSADFFGTVCTEPGSLYAQVALGINSVSDLVLLRSVIDGGLVFDDQVLSSSMTTGHWHHILLQSTYGTAGHIHIEVDGLVAIDRDETILCNSPVSHELMLGAYAYNTSPRCDAYIDNVLVDVH